MVSVVADKHDQGVFIVDLLQVVVQGIIHILQKLSSGFVSVQKLQILKGGDVLVGFSELQRVIENVLETVFLVVTSAHGAIRALEKPEWIVGVLIVGVAGECEALMVHGRVFESLLNFSSELQRLRLAHI